MWLSYWLFGFLGWMLTGLIVGFVLILVVCWCCGVSVDSLVTWGDDSATLTCFHCGQETSAAGKTCEHCGGELQ